MQYGTIPNTYPPREERRSAPRRRLFKSATISPDGHDTVFDCVLRNLSATGARMKVQSQIGIPKAFHLRSRDISIDTEAHIVWRNDKEIGVEFAGV